MPARIIYKTGDKLHPESRLTFVKDVDGFTQRKALFICDCGKRNISFVASVKNGTAKSCGCLQKETASTHGMDGTPEYKTWVSMRARCGNKNDKDYKNYGDRGITVCDRWGKFEAFYSDMGNRPTAGHSIDRKDNDGNYSPGNCRWSTVSEQARNRRSNTNITFEGKTQCLTAWANEIGVNSSTISSRIKNGWSVRKSLTTQPGVITNA